MLHVLFFIMRTVGMLRIPRLNVVMLNVVMLNVVMLNVVMPNVICLIVMMNFDVPKCH
jgi:hypothetical protein